MTGAGPTDKAMSRYNRTYESNRNRDRPGRDGPYFCSIRQTPDVRPARWAVNSVAVG